MISFNCPECAKNYTVPDEMAGKRGKCKCGAAIQIPPKDSNNTPSPVVRHSEKQPSATSCVENKCPCPFCGEMILAVAIKCKHCGEMLHTKNQNKCKIIMISLLCLIFLSILIIGFWRVLGNESTNAIVNNIANDPPNTFNEDDKEVATASYQNQNEKANIQHDERNQFLIQSLPLLKSFGRMQRLQQIYGIDLPRSEYMDELKQMISALDNLSKPRNDKLLLLRSYAEGAVNNYIEGAKLWQTAMPLPSTLKEFVDPNDAEKLAKMKKDIDRVEEAVRALIDARNNIEKFVEMLEKIQGEIKGS